MNDEISLESITNHCYVSYQYSWDLNDLVTKTSVTVNVLINIDWNYVGSVILVEW